jgi:hypothetical protein
VGEDPGPPTADRQSVLGVAIPGRQLPQVDPHIASISCPQLGHGRSTAAAEAGRSGRSPSGMARSGPPAPGRPDAGRRARAGTPCLRAIGPERLCLGRDCRPPPASHCFSLSSTGSQR